MSSVQILIQKEKKTISKTGGTAAMYLPKEVRKYIAIGDLVDINVKIEGDRIVLILSKSLFNFSLNDLKNLLKKCDFKIKKEETVGDVKIFQSERKKLYFSYTKNLFESLSPAYITITKKFSDLDYKKYNAIVSQTQKSNKFDIITRPEGDLDTINILKDPEFYKTDMKGAFNLLKKADKKIGLSVIIRFNNKKNTIEEIKSAIEYLIKSDS